VSDERWHRGSRFWTVTPWVVLLSAAITIWLKDPITFISVTTPWVTIAGGKSVASTWKGTGP